MILATAIIIFRRQLVALGGTAPIKPLTFRPPKRASQLHQLAEYADRLYAEKKWLAAEKAYLNVLKADHKNVTAYSHLGVIYTTQKNLGDAIECFEIATRLRPAGSTYQNLGLAYYENRNYKESIAAFEKAIMFEPTAHRHAVLSKAYKKAGKLPQAITTLKQAVALEQSQKMLQLLAQAYEDAGRRDDAAAIYDQIRTLEQISLTNA